MIPIVHGTTQEERIARILDVTLEVFSEFSFDDATTAEIAKRARFSKRDIYAYFPDKQALLIGLVNREMRRQNETFQNTIANSQKLDDIRKKLEFIGMAIVKDTVSPTMAVVRRLVISKSISQPFLGGLLFEDLILQRCKLIAEVLLSHTSRADTVKVADLERVSRRYFAVIASFPWLMTDVGLRGQWVDEIIQAHVEGETDYFLRLHADFT
jgi:AcrR family transcriptional regulator